jgi:FkbM family methyltransferase
MAGIQYWLGELMPKRYLFLFVPGVFALAIGATKLIAGPAARTQGYFALQRQWAAHWPLQNGKMLPRAIRPIFQPFTPVWVQLEPKIKMQLDPNDYVSREILETGVWEAGSWAAVREHLESGATFVDIGAHIGYYSLKAAPVVGPSGHVIAIEPNPETIDKLRRNIQASMASSITVEPVACSDSDGTLELFAAPGSNTGESSLARSNAAQEGELIHSYHVRARPLDAIIRETGISRVDAVKIDVEGAEFLVLKGAGETLSRFHPVVVVELVEHQLQAMGTSSREVFEFFKSHGYSARRSFGANVEFVPDASLTSQTDPARSRAGKR